MPPLTYRQRCVLDFIWESLEARGYPPTIREIGAEFAIRSPNGVKSHLNALEKKRMIQLDRGIARGMRLLVKPPFLRLIVAETLRCA